MNSTLTAPADLAPDVLLDGTAQNVISLLSSGGDARIALDPETGLNQYLSAPYPRSIVAYASSTANDISLAAFRHLTANPQLFTADYQERLDDLRGRLRATYTLDRDVEIVFAPSGTDLEYVALACSLGKAAAGIHNILLGAVEVGSGCIHSAHGRYFAQQTALGMVSVPGEDVDGFGSVSLVDIPVRGEQGEAYSSAAITQAIAGQIEAAHAQGKQALVHIVHGSKTGLILPNMDDLDDLQARYGEEADFVVDACQARITTEALKAYLARGIMVFLTGSKFMGGPPFNGFALVPGAKVRAAAPMPAGLTKIFRQAEFPADWAGASNLTESDNPGLALRLEASIFELERFQTIALDRVALVISAFNRAIFEQISEPLGFATVAPFAPSEAGEAKLHPIEMRSLVTLDVRTLPATCDFDRAQAFHRKLALDGVRLGQPVKVAKCDGTWAGTLRIGLSMANFNAWTNLTVDELSACLQRDMRGVRERIEAVAAAV